MQNSNWNLSNVNLIPSNVDWHSAYSLGKWQSLTRYAMFQSGIQPN